MDGHRATSWCQVKPTKCVPAGRRYTQLDIKMPGFFKLSRLNERAWELEGSMCDNNDSPDDERIRLHVRGILERFAARQRQKNSAVATEVDREENRPVRVRNGGDPA